MSETPISDSIAAEQSREKTEREAWALGDYEPYPCPHCGRHRLCKCPNGKHRCQKCNWVPEDEMYAPIGGNS
jgi:ribosomal protein L37AE/L43A